MCARNGLHYVVNTCRALGVNRVLSEMAPNVNMALAMEIFCPNLIEAERRPSPRIFDDHLVLVHVSETSCRWSLVVGRWSLYMTPICMQVSKHSLIHFSQGNFAAPQPLRIVVFQDALMHVSHSTDGHYRAAGRKLIQASPFLNHIYHWGDWENSI